MAAKRSTNACTGARLDWRKTFYLNDACQHGFAGVGGAAHLQQARAVDGACVHRVAHGFVQNAFTSNREAVYGAVAFKHYAIKRNALARFHAQHSTPGWMDATGVESHSPLGCSTSNLYGREHHQGFNGIAGAVGSASTIHSAMAYSAITITRFEWQPWLLPPVGNGHQRVDVQTTAQQ